jgi:hypothetical protein
VRVRGYRIQKRSALFVEDELGFGGARQPQECPHDDGPGRSPLLGVPAGEGCLEWLPYSRAALARVDLPAANVTVDIMPITIRMP